MLPFNHPPYGYRVVRTPQVPQGVVVLDEVEATHVRQMFRWVLDEDRLGHRRGIVEMPHTGAILV